MKTAISSDTLPPRPPPAEWRPAGRTSSRERRECSVRRWAWPSWRAGIPIACGSCRSTTRSSRWSTTPPSASCCAASRWSPSTWDGRDTPRSGARSRGLLGLLTIGEMALGDIGMDQLLMRHYVVDSNPHPGRMAINTAAFFVLAGPLLFAHGTLPRFQRRSLLTGSLGAITLGQGVVALSGYFTGVTTTSAWGNMTLMAVHTAFGFAVLGIGLIALAWSDDDPSTRSRAPRWLPVLVGVGGTTVTLCLWQSLLVQERTHIQREVQAKILSVTNGIDSQLGERLMMLQRLGHRWEQDAEPNEKRWAYDARLLTRDAPDIHGVAWVDPAGVVRWAVPIERNRQAIGLSFASDERRRSTLADSARDAPADALASGRPGHRRQGLPGARADLSRRPGTGLCRWGLPHQDRDRPALPARLSLGYSLSISSRGRGDLPAWAKRVRPASWAQTAVLRAPAQTWRVTLWPSAADPRAAAILRTCRRPALRPALFGSRRLGGPPGAGDPPACRDRRCGEPDPATGGRRAGARRTCPGRGAREGTRDLRQCRGRDLLDSTATGAFVECQQGLVRRLGLPPGGADRPALPRAGHPGRRGQEHCRRYRHHGGAAGEQLRESLSPQERHLRPDDLVGGLVAKPAADVLRRPRQLLPRPRRGGAARRRRALSHDGEQHLAAGLDGRPEGRCLLVQRPLVRLLGHHPGRDDRAGLARACCIRTMRRG